VDSEILHSGEGRELEQWLEPQNKSFVFAIACLYLCCFYFIFLHLIHSYLSVFTHFNKKAIEHLNS